MGALSGEWLYCKIYVGSGEGALDYAIVEAVSRLRRNLGGAPWFFLRYFDAGGPHMRLRVQASDWASADRVRAIVESIADEVLELLAARPPSHYRPLIDLEPTKVTKQFPVGFEFDTYVPEEDKFGGPAGVRIAENVFCASSELAATILELDRGLTISRKTLAPVLMDRIARTFLAEGLLSGLWKHYSFYWLGGESHAANEWRERFMRQAEKLINDGVAILTDVPTQPVELGDRYAVFEAALEEAHGRLADVDGLPPTEVESRFAFQFAHLMNNRLGFVPVEEAYLAVMLEAVLDRS